MSVERVIKLRFDDLEQVIVKESLDEPIVASDVGGCNASCGLGVYSMTSRDRTREEGAR